MRQKNILKVMKMQTINHANVSIIGVSVVLFFRYFQVKSHGKTFKKIK